MNLFVESACILLFFLIPISSQLPSCEILSLLDFKKSITHDSTGYIVDSWDDETIDFNGCPSSWNGIVCDGANVAAIIVDNRGLGGMIDLSVFANFTMLFKLSMRNNNLTGNLPEKLDGFQSLKFLDISDNLFYGKIPNVIGSFKRLQNLSFSGNNFSGWIPNSIGGLVSIQSLDLSRNLLSGQLPSALKGLKSLVSLNLSYNAFSKEVPAKLEDILSLESLDLSWNQLDGDVNWGFLMASSAVHVDLSGNLLKSSKNELRFLAQLSETLKYLNLSNNQLSGSLIDEGEISTFGNLKVLDLSYNQLSGALPGFDYVYDLEVLKLGNNEFVGFLPNGILKGESLMLRELDLSANNLAGHIGLITSTTLQVLNLSSNQISGELPFHTGSCTILDLSNNQLSGNLSLLSKWGNNLEYLDLGQNQLTGLIPEQTSQFLRLNYLNLSHNSISSTLPNFLIQLPKLTILDLGSNLLNGPMPNFRKSNIQILILSNNHFYGTFPENVVSLTQLQVLDISANNFSGFLPQAIANLTNLTSLDISLNQFTGPLPSTLPDTLVYFNASNNDLSGIIPPNLQKFPDSCFHPGNSRLQFCDNSLFANQTRKHLKTSSKIAIIASCVIFAFAILVLVATFVHFKKFSRKASTNKEIGQEVKKPAGAGAGISCENYPPQESLPTLAGELHFLDETITITPEEFSRAPAEILGRSSIGTSYRATLDNGVFLNVKWLREGVAKEKKEFIKEVNKFVKIRHPNVVGLRGYYWGAKEHEKLILSDFISPGSLASFLYDLPGRKGPNLTWAQRLKIAVDIARGLNYLHLDRAIPHGNIKPTNILLDGLDLNSRVSDCCLHRLLNQSGTADQILDSRALGYRAPELASSKKPTPTFKSDVYGFGVVLLEMLTGKCAGDMDDFTGWVRVRVSEGRGSDCFDPALSAEVGASATVMKGMKEMLGIGLRCVGLVSERPGIRSVYEDLSTI